MPINEESTPAHPKVRRGFRMAFLGLLCGFIGLGIATYRMSVEAKAPPSPKKQEIIGSLADAIKKTVDKFRPKEVNPPPPPADVSWPVSRKLGLAATVCGFVAVVMGCISWLVREQRRWTWAALCVGIAAMAWTHVVVAVAIAVAAAIFLTILGSIS